MTTSQDRPSLPGIQRVHPPNGIRMPIHGGDAGPLSLDPNLVPRPPVRPEDVPRGAAPAVPMPAFLAPAAIAAAPQPVTIPWWLEPNTTFLDVQNHPPQIQILWVLGQLHLGKLQPGTTREGIIGHYLANGLGDAAGAATREFDSYFMSQPQAAPPPAATPAAAAQAQPPVVFDFETYSKRQEARAVALAVEANAADAAIGQLYGPEGILYAQHLRSLPKIDQSIAAMHAQAAERRETLPQTPPAHAAPAAPASQPVPVAPQQAGPIAATTSANGRMTTARKLEAEQAFAAGKSVAEVSAKLGLPVERIERAHREWLAQGGKIGLTAEEALPPTSPLMQALAQNTPPAIGPSPTEMELHAVTAERDMLQAELNEQRASRQAMSDHILTLQGQLMQVAEAREAIAMPQDGALGRAMIQAVTIAGRVGVSFNTLLLLLEELDRFTPEERSTLTGTMRGLAASREG